ncbi:MAG: hypothetical protein DRN71_01345 [Candidatus Nanohalarchaeota archaeon]|nr:MAG: hypothetical protein DRN71_01345 [Candidatus Nanohaloarchaeota archaeon]
MPTTGGFGEPFRFAMFNLVVASILSIVMFFATSEKMQLLQLKQALVSQGLYLNAFVALWLLSAIVMGAIGLFVSSAIYHLFLKLVGSKKNYEITFRVMAYLTAFSLLIWIPIINIFVLIYYFYIFIIVLKEIHEITLMRVITAIILMTITLFITLSIIVIAIGYMWTANIQQTNQLNTSLTSIDVNKPEFQCGDSNCTSILIQLNNPTKDNAMKVIDILEKRIYEYGIRKNQLQPIEIDGKLYVQLQIPIPNINKEELRELIERHGKFKAIIDRNITFKGRTAVFNFNKKPHDIALLPSGAIEIGDVALEVNDTIDFEGVQIKYVNRTDDDVIILRAFVIASEDIEQVFNNAQHTSISRTGSNWQYQFSIKISQTAANRLAKVTNDLTKEFSGSRSYLSSNIDLYLDGELIDSQKISSDLQGKAQDNILISGPGNSRDDAWKNINHLQSILESGALPTEIKIIQINTT